MATSHAQSIALPPSASAASYISVRSLTEAIAEPLSAEDQTAQSMPDVSPTKWHRAHVTWFFEEFVLGPNVAGYQPFHPGYQYLFNSYYNAVGARHPRPERGAVTRPGITEIGEYRAYVDAAMVELIGQGTSDDVAGLIELGLHHERQHQELALMDIKHVLSRNVLDPVYRPATGTTGQSAAGPLRWHEHPGGLVEVGHRGHGFSFDNEGPRHQQFLRPFVIADRLVTCGEIAAFIADGGYQRPELWLSDGWATVTTQGWDAPLYWRNEDGDHWTVFTLGGRKTLDPDEPVCHVSYYEADAFGRWADARLPTEGEWEAVAAGRAIEGNLLDLDVLHPAPIEAVGTWADPTARGANQPETTAPAAADSSPSQLFGDVWEWTGSAYLPYPGFRPASGAVGEYNGKFMVNQHVLRGGGCLTPPGHVRASYRNYFPPAARWPMTGVRLAKDLET